MRLASLEAVLRALDAADVAYLVVGGVAVNAYGYSRATADLDLVVGLSQENALAAVSALAELGYRPQVPVEMDAFADAELRRQWVMQKRMQVLSLYSDVHRETTVDLFVTEPFDFESEHRRAEIMEFAAGLHVPVLRLPALIAMKYAAGRSRDRDDAEHLTTLMHARSGGNRE